MASKLDPKMQRKLTWQITRKREIIISMRGAETSRYMLPYWRGVHLHKTASFKMIFLKIQTNHNNYKPDPKSIETSISKTMQTMMRKIIEQYYPKYAETFRCWFPLWIHVIEMFPG